MIGLLKRIYYLLASHSARLIIYSCLAAVLVIGGVSWYVYAKQAEQNEGEQVSQIDRKTQLLQEYQQLVDKTSELKQKGYQVGAVEQELAFIKSLIDDQNRLDEAEVEIAKAKKMIEDLERSPPAESIEKGNILGKITFQNQPVPQADVSLYASKKKVTETKSDSNGLYQLTADVGKYQLWVVKDGYNTYIKSNVTVKKGEQTNLNISLSKIGGGDKSGKNGGANGVSGSTPTPPPNLTPTPTPTQNPNGLTRSGIIQYTNNHRRENGIAELHENALLNRAADNKIADLFQYQYFSHNNPVTGKQWYQFVQDVGYQYSYLGENLALSSYGSDEFVVNLWMNSGGHRRNILDPNFVDIGVGVGYGNFQGDNVWLAVQIFGRPK